MNFLSLLLLVGEEPALLSGWPTFFNRNIFLSTLSCLCTEGRVNYLAGIGWLQFFLRVVELASSLLLILVRYKLFLIELNSPTSSTGSFLDSRLSVCGFSMEFHCLTRVMEVWRLTFGLALAFYLGLTLMKGLLSISSYQGQMVYICQYCLFLGLWKTYQMLYWFWLQEQPSAPSLNNFIYYIRLLTCSQSHSTAHQPFSQPKLHQQAESNNTQGLPTIMRHRLWAATLSRSSLPTPSYSDSRFCPSSQFWSNRRKAQAAALQFASCWAASKGSGHRCQSRS